MTSELHCKIYIDFDRDGFGTTGDDVSAYWQSTRIQAGMQNERAHCASVGRCTLELDNSTKVFSPDYAAGTYYGKLVPNLPVRVDVSDGAAVTVTVFRGVVTTWQPASGHIHGPRSCTVICEDLMGVLQDAAIALPLQENENAATVLTKVCALAFNGGLATASVTQDDYISTDSVITIGDRTYTWKTALTGAANEVLIDADAGDDGEESALLNLAYAINGEGTAGTDYGLSTSAHQYVTAEAVPGYGATSDTLTSWVSLRKTGTVYDELGVLIFFSEERANSTMKLWMRKQGTPTGTLTITLEHDAFFEPSGELIDVAATATVTEASLSATGGWVVIDWGADLTFNPVIRYFLRIVTDRAAHASNYVDLGTRAQTSNDWGLYGEVAGAWTDLTLEAGILSPGTLALSANCRGAWGNALVLTDDDDNVTRSGDVFTGGSDEPAGLMSFTAGDLTLPLSADSWDNTNGLRAVGDVADSTYGLFWAARAGTLTFKPHNWVFEQQPATVALDVSDTPDSIDPRVSLDDIANEIVVEYIPRRRGAVGVIARASGPIEVPARAGVGRHNTQADIDANTHQLTMLESSSGKFVGATDIIAPVAGTDYTVRTGTLSTSEFDTSSTTVTNSRDVTAGNKIKPTLAKTGGGLQVTFKSIARRALVVHGFQTRGTALIAYDKQQVIKRDATSIAAYGVRTMKIKLPFPTDQRFAESIAAYELSRRKDPHTLISKVTWRGTRTVGSTHLYSVDLGNTITISDTQTAISSHRYLVHGWSCSLSVSGDHSLTWLVRRLDDQQTWILEDANYSQLETSTILAL